MDKLILFTEIDRKKLVNKESRDSKLGNHVQLITQSCNIYDQLKSLDVDFVIFGIPEDIGIFASNGKSGAYHTWRFVVKVLLNIQNNEFINSKKIAILGHLDFSEEQTIVSELDRSKPSHIKRSRKMVEEIDKNVTQLVHDIVKAGKKPIVIGGGHNNAYGCLKGTSLAHNTAINAVNLDAHFDFDPENGRHSRNAFSYAYAEGFLKNYFAFGIHENYIVQHVFETIKKLKKRIAYNLFEDITIRKNSKFKGECKRALTFVSSNPFGIEIDCSAIENIPSNAMTPSGFSTNKTREFLSYVASHENAAYLHISEANSRLGPKKMAKQTAKLITSLITDFIKSNQVNATD